MHDFLYELYLIHRKHFIDASSPIIVSYFEKYHFPCFNEKKQNFKCEPQYFTFLMSKSFTINHSVKLGAL